MMKRLAKNHLFIVFVCIFCVIGLVGCNGDSSQEAGSTSQTITYDVVKRNFPDTFMKSSEEVAWSWKFTLIRATKNSKAESFTIDPFNPNVEGYTFQFVSSDSNLVVENGKVINKGAKPGKYTITATIEGENLKEGKGEIVVPITITE